nr:PREDICTED: uncharacterized protein LOC108194712 [Daucus carota subsp. sativus]
MAVLIGCQLDACISYRAAAMSSPDNNHEPSPEVQSTDKDSNSTPDPDVILIDNDAATDSKMVVEGGSGKERSEVWNHYTKKTLDDVLKAVCKYCSKQLKGDSGSDHPQLAAYNFNQEAAKTELAKMIDMHEYPLCIVDQVGFKRYSAVLQPLFKVICGTTHANIGSKTAAIPMIP